AEDTCVAIFWAAPLSYSGEDIAELMLHGSPVLMRRVMAQCQLHGARLAEPGEFTYRAYVSGKLDLSQAEAVQELISAGSSRALSLAAAQLAGLPGRRIYEWQAQLHDLLANIEVIHDYAADDLDASLDQEALLTSAKLTLRMQNLIAAMDTVLDASARTASMRSSITIAICGPPNVGKSTLFNALLGHERALTAPEPGTTRDYLTETLETAGVLLTLVDTAGQHETSDSVEAAGVANATEWARSADRVLWVIAADSAEKVGVVRQQGDNPIFVLTRCDLLPVWPEDTGIGDTPVYAVSGLTGRGIPELWAALLESQAQLDEPALESLGSRQAQAVQAARDALSAAVSALQRGMPMDAAAVDIYAALDHLHGTFEQSDHSVVIERIFSGFCVGK
nr:50S ribosome-binding GTPase [bacterium]